VAFTDDDCIVDSKWLLNIYNSFANDELDCGMVGGKVLPLWLSNKPEWLQDYFLGPLGILDYGNNSFIMSFNKKDYKSDGLFFGNNYAFRKYLFQLYSGFDEKMFYSQDSEICLRFFKAGIKGFYNPDVIVSHKIAKDKMTQKYLCSWFYKRSKFWEDISITQYRYPLMPESVYFILKFLIELSKFLFSFNQYRRTIHCCHLFLYLGKIEYYTDIDRFKIYQRIKKLIQ
jgi:GT2 family glycosyltransferase